LLLSNIPYIENIRKYLKRGNVAIGPDCYLSWEGGKCSGINPLNQLGMGYGKYAVSIKAAIKVADVL
jgi:hypothetical protein